MKALTTRIIAGLAVVTVIVFVAQSCIDSKGEEKSIPKASEPIPVKVISLERSSTTTQIVTSGRVTTDDETTLAFKTGGVVQSVNVKEGDKVTRGQVLATLDLTEINALRSQASIAVEKAKRDFERTKNLHADSVATLEQLQNTESAYELAKAQLNAADFNRSFSQIKAPADGYVLKKFVNAGQVVGLGDPVIRTNGAGHADWIVKVGVSDKQWNVIKIKNKATVTLDAFADQKFDGVVIRKSETADAATGAFTVEIVVKNKDARLASGMFASVNIQSGQQSNSWSIPYDAVLDANGKEAFVFVTNDNKVAIKTPVVIDSFDNNYIQVSSGLEDAKAIIIAGSAYLTDKSPITIVK
jgi:RND family efflux transporter MFP subunit